MTEEITKTGLQDETTEVGADQEARKIMLDREVKTLSDEIQHGFYNDAVYFSKIMGLGQLLNLAKDLALAKPDRFTRVTQALGAILGNEQAVTALESSMMIAPTLQTVRDYLDGKMEIVS